MRIYIAGPITGLDENAAFAAFAEAERAIEAAGHTPVNPMRLVDQTPGRDYFEYLMDAVKIMALESDAVYLLDNWQDSKGARWERWFAVTFERPIYRNGYLPKAVGAGQE